MNNVNTLNKYLIKPIEVDQFPLEIPDLSSFTFTDRTAKNVSEYTHGFHIYPAKFIPQIPRWAINYALKSKNIDSILDPFCGSGTSLVEARLMGINSYGLDINPIAQLLTEVKTTPIFLNQSNLLFEIKEKLINNIRNFKGKINIENDDDINLHSNWNFWFECSVIEDLIKIKRCIRDFSFDDKNDETIRKFFLVGLSTIIKKVSYFDEKEIKVRKKFEKFKVAPNPIKIFSEALDKLISGMIDFNNVCLKHPNTWARVIGDDSTSIKLKNQSIDLVITSPPYINAIDYPMAHKYNMFILDMVLPDNFKEHCRKYIGMTERAVKKDMYNKIHLTGYSEIDEIIEKIYNLNIKPEVDKKRAFIIYQYFSGMEKSILEMKRVLKENSKCIIVLGDNIIRKIHINTPILIKNMAVDIGFEYDVSFFHEIKKRKLSKGRNHTGGKIQREMITILKR